MRNNNYEFLGKCGVVLFIIVLFTGVENFDLVFRGVVFILLVLWFVPCFKNDAVYTEGVKDE